jgi:hypothetical protein
MVTHVITGGRRERYGFLVNGVTSPPLLEFRNGTERVELLVANYGPDQYREVYEMSADAAIDLLNQLAQAIAARAGALAEGRIV